MFVCVCGFFFFQAEDGIRDLTVTGVQTCALPISSQVVLGSEEQAEQTLAESERSETINTSFVERWFGTQRQFNARKKRKAYTFSKERSEERRVGKECRSRGSQQKENKKKRKKNKK